MDNFYLLILSNVILLVVVNMYFSMILYKGQVFYKIQYIYQCFIIGNALYIGLTKSLLIKTPFLFTGVPFGLFYGPFFYIGLAAIFSEKLSPIKSVLRHFYLGFLAMVVFVVLCVFFMEDQEVLDYYSLVLYLLVFLQMTFYTFYTYIKFNAVIKEKKSIAVMSQYVIVLLATSLIFLASIFSGFREKAYTFNGIVLYLLMFSGVVIMFRYNLIVLIRKFNYYKKTYNGKMFFEFIKGEIDPYIGSKLAQVTGEVVEEEAVKYQKSRISDLEMQTYMKKLKKALEEKIYLNSDLTLDMLATKTRIPKYHLTQVFNLGLNSNFNKYINGKRVEHAVSILDNVDNMDTIEEIMMQSGFNSRSSFYRAFNVYYDISPADYRKRALS